MRRLCAVLCVLTVYIEQTTSKLDVPNEDMLLFWRRSNIKCKPFTAFKIDCNQCVCSAEGTSSCTRMDCGTRVPVVRTRKTTFKKLPTSEYYSDETNESDKKEGNKNT